MSGNEGYSPESDLNVALTPKQREQLNAAIREGIGEASLEDEVQLEEVPPENKET